MYTGIKRIQDWMITGQGDNTRAYFDGDRHQTFTCVALLGAGNIPQEISVGISKGVLDFDGVDEVPLEVMKEFISRACIT